MKLLPEVCLGQGTQSIQILVDDQNYDPHPIHNHCSGGLQSLTDCLVILFISKVRDSLRIYVRIACVSLSHFWNY